MSRSLRLRHGTSSLGLSYERRGDRLRLDLGGRLNRQEPAYESVVPQSAARDRPEMNPIFSEVLRNKFKSFALGR